MDVYIRLAKTGDAERLAQVHRVCSADQPGGFMHRLGQSFLVQYYRILLQESRSVVLCAEDTDGHILGLCSGSLSAEEHMAALQRGKLQLLRASIPSLVRTPRLIQGMYSRQKSESADREEGSGYVVLSGPREEFWAWLPTERNSGGAIELHKKWLSLMRLLGAPNVRLEVDRVNIKVERMHSLMGAKVIREFVTPDGRRRVVMEYSLVK